MVVVVAMGGLKVALVVAKVGYRWVYVSFGEKNTRVFPRIEEIE